MSKIYFIHNKYTHSAAKKNPYRERERKRVQNRYRTGMRTRTEWVQNRYRTDTERISNGYRMVTDQKKEKSVLECKL